MLTQRFRRQRGCPATPARAASTLLPLLLALVTAFACREEAELVPLRADALLLAPDREALDHRLRLVEAGRYADAHALWAARALLPSLSSTDESAEMAWNRQIAAALEVAAAKGAVPHALDRLARALDRARWFRESRAVLERERAIDSLDEESKRILSVTSNLTGFATALDSTARARYAAIERSEKPVAAPTIEVGRLVTRFGLTLEALQSRGFYLGVRPSRTRQDVDEIQLATIVGHEGPFSIMQGEKTVNARRIVFDDNFIAPYRGQEAWPWEPGSIAIVEDGTLVVYHDRSALRRAATLLYLELERRGGRAPDDMRSPGDAPLAAGDPASDAGTGAESRAAQDLRLRTLSPLFDRTRAEGGPRAEMMRRFIVEVVRGRMVQIEAGEARRVVAERAQPGSTGGMRGFELRFLGALRYGPLPGLRLADALDSSRRRAASDVDGEAARAVVTELRRLAALENPGQGDRASNPQGDLVRLGEDELRALAARIEAERSQ